MHILQGTLPTYLNIHGHEHDCLSSLRAIFWSVNHAGFDDAEKNSLDNDCHQKGGECESCRFWWYGKEFAWKWLSSSKRERMWMYEYMILMMPNNNQIRLCSILLQQTFKG